MNNRGPLKRNDELIAHYERLRADVQSTAAPPGAGPSSGRVLFLCRGMRVWMRAWSSCMRKGVETVTPRPPASPHDTSEIREQLTHILAGVILGREQEAFR